MLGETRTVESSVITARERTSALGRVQSTGGLNQFLAISLDTEQRFVVGRKRVAGSEYAHWHSFIHESLLGFSECEYEFRNNGQVLATGSVEKYIQSLKRDFEPLMDDEGRSNIQIDFRISRKAIAQAIQQILNHLELDFHNRGVIHGDIKPQNCLITEGGAYLIDSLELETGKISPALSPMWAAPEQIAMMPASEPTDIYPIGLMLVSLLSGQLTGEVVRYQIPSEQKDIAIVSFIRNPVVYFNTQDSIVSADGREAWIRFVEKCIRFAPTERYSSTAECAIELGNLVDRYPPSGWLPLQLQRGDLRMVRLPNGNNAISRIIYDTGYGGIILQPTHLRNPPPPPPEPAISPVADLLEPLTEVLCPRCGFQNPSEWAFCQQCGFNLGRAN